MKSNKMSQTFTEDETNHRLDQITAYFADNNLSPLIMMLYFAIPFNNIHIGKFKFYNFEELVKENYNINNSKKFFDFGIVPTGQGRYVLLSKVVCDEHTVYIFREHGGDATEYENSGIIYDHMLIGAIPKSKRLTDTTIIKIINDQQFRRFPEEYFAEHPEYLVSV